MPFQPETGDEIQIDGTTYRIGAHPAAPGMPYGQEGRQATVYALEGRGQKRAIKVFKSRYRTPSLAGLTELLAPFAAIPGLQVCIRSVITPQRHGALLQAHPDLLYAVVMPWIEGPTWMEIVLQKDDLSDEQSLMIGNAFASLLASMEQRRIAHCDLSGPNILLPALMQDSRQNNEDGPQSFVPSTSSGQALRPGVTTPVELVDVEQMYGPGMERPEHAPGGSPGYAGYAHRNAQDGVWESKADRFAGAVILAEMLGWCDERVRSAAWGESYFDPDEMQGESERLLLLTSVLRERYGEGTARLLERAWESKSLQECPTFGEWMVSLPRGATATTTTSSADTSVRALMDMASRFEAQGNAASALDTYRQALSLAPAGGALAQELDIIVGELGGKAADGGQKMVVEGRQTTSDTQQATGNGRTTAGSTPATVGQRATEAGAVASTVTVGQAVGEQRAAQPLSVQAPKPKRDMRLIVAPALLLVILGVFGAIALMQAQTNSNNAAAPITAPTETQQATQVAIIDNLPTPQVVTTPEATQAVAESVATLPPTQAASGADQPTATVGGAAARATPGEETDGFGVLRFHDASAAHDDPVLSEATLAVQGLPFPLEGKQYEAWLVGDGGENRLSMGTVKLDDTGRGVLDYRDPDGDNLLSTYTGFEITSEPNPDGNPLPSGEVAFAGTLPAQAFEHMRHLVEAFPETPDGTALCVGLFQQAVIANQLAQGMVLAQEQGDLTRMRRNAEGLIYVIEGKNGKNTGDLDGDGEVLSPGDGYGLLLNGKNLGYVQGTIEHTKNTERTPDVTSNMLLHGGHASVSAQNVGEWAVELRDLSLKIGAATDAATMKGDVQAAASLANKMLNGKDIDGNEQVDPAPGEGGAKTAYEHSQYMAFMRVRSPGSIPTGGNGTPAPTHDMNK